MFPAVVRVLDNIIKCLYRSLTVKNPDMTRCLSALEELSGLSLSPLMFKKQPDIVQTIRKLRNYAGPRDDKDKGASKDKALAIRLKADQIYSHLRSAFSTPDGADFWKSFDDQVSAFRNAVKGMDSKKVALLTVEPVN